MSSALNFGKCRIIKARHLMVTLNQYIHSVHNVHVTYVWIHAL